MQKQVKGFGSWLIEWKLSLGSLHRRWTEWSTSDWRSKMLHSDEMLLIACQWEMLQRSYLPQGTCTSSLISKATTKAITNTLLKQQLEIKHFFYSRICVGYSSARLHFDAENTLSCTTSSSSKDPMPFSVSAMTIVGHLKAVEQLTHWNEPATLASRQLERVLWSCLKPMRPSALNGFIIPLFMLPKTVCSSA